MNINTYLCGGIFQLTDAQCRSWREEAKELLTTSTLDPMRRDYRGIEAENLDNIVNEDLKDIENSKFLLVNARRPSWGTAMEIVYAYKMHKTIVAFTEEEPFPAIYTPVSPWLQYHCNKVFNFLSDACDYINGETKKL